MAWASRWLGLFLLGGGLSSASAEMVIYFTLDSFLNREVIVVGEVMEVAPKLSRRGYPTDMKIRVKEVLKNPEIRPKTEWAVVPSEIDVMLSDSWVNTPTLEELTLKPGVTGIWFLDRSKYGFHGGHGLLSLPLSKRNEVVKKIEEEASWIRVPNPSSKRVQAQLKDRAVAREQDELRRMLLTTRNGSR